jgi:adenylosuccinate lyase
MTSILDHSRYLSPFSHRYGSHEMRAVWSEEHKRRLWRRFWAALARAQQSAGLVREDQAADLAAHIDQVDIAASEAVEARIHHDLMAEIEVFASQCAVGGGIIHLGATSADIEDNADVVRMRESFDIILPRLTRLLHLFADQIERFADTLIMAFTHMQPAEPTTLGFRLALYTQDLLDDWQTLQRLRAGLKAKGFRGAVGTSASYAELLSGTSMDADEMERLILAQFDLTAYPVTSQTYPRRQDWQVMCGLAGLAGSLYKFAFDLRLLQSPAVGEWSEPFAKSQVGSSAMPFKRNPINAEKLNSLGRLVASMTRIAWDNAAHALLERTLDDSANRREMLPTAFLAVDEMLLVAERLVEGLQVDEAAARRNLERFGVFAAVERLLIASVKAGADRQRMHEHLREQSLAAWAAATEGRANPLVENLSSSSFLRQYLTPERIRALLDASGYVGTAPKRARAFAGFIRDTLSQSAAEDE